MHRRLGPAALSALLVLALAACGGSGGGSSNGISSKSPDQIVAAATSAVATVKSVHVAGTVAASGSQKVTLNLSLVNGKGGKGSMTQNGLGFQIVAVGPEVYINGSAAFWRAFAGAAAAQLLSGKWLKAPASGQLSSLATLTNAQKLFSQLLSSHGKLAKGKTTTIQGQKVVGVTDTTNGGTLYVAATGKPYPIELTKSGTTGGQIVFDRFNQPVALTPPANAVDISKLQ